jgi:hypothetical protein
LLAYVADGLAPKEISRRVQVPEDEIYRLIVWVLDELEPSAGDTMRDVYAGHGGRRATTAELEEFERWALTGSYEAKAGVRCLASAAAGLV